LYNLANETYGLASLALRFLTSLYAQVARRLRKRAFY